MGGIDTTWSRRALAGILCATLMLGGCSPSYIGGRYGATTPSRQVVLNCRDVYEVFDRADADSLLVTSSLGTEATANVCGHGQTRQERFQAAAERYFLETNRAPACRILRANELSPTHFEFAYRCG